MLIKILFITFILINTNAFCLESDYGDFEAELAIYFLEAGHYILTLTDENGVATSKRFVKE